MSEFTDDFEARTISVELALQLINVNSNVSAATGARPVDADLLVTRAKTIHAFLMGS